MTETYNGWTNYETWLVNIHVDNAGGWDFVLGEVITHINNFFANHDDRVWQVANRMKNWFEDNIVNPDEVASEMVNGSLMIDMLRAAASRVDWRELAMNFYGEE